MQHHEAETDQLTAAGEVLSRYLHSRAGDFLRGLRMYSESGSDTTTSEQAARALRASARRIGGTLFTYRGLFDPVWADHLRTELAWLSGTLAQEHACTARLHRLVAALARLSGLNATPDPVPAAASAAPGVSAAPGAGATVPLARTAGTATAAHASGPANGSAPRDGAPQEPVLAPAPAPAALTVGASRAGALLDRQLTLARTRAHSAALQALGSSRFHAVADAVAVLASEVPLAPGASSTAPDALDGPGERALHRLLDAVSALPLARASHPYNAEALVHGLSTASEGEAQDAPWHQVRQLLRLHRYAQEVWCPGGGSPEPLLTDAGRSLDRHRDAAEASAAAANAARTPRIAPATAYALGVLHADQRLEVEAARFAFQQLWGQATAAPAR